MVHLGLAWRHHLDGDMLKAIRRLGMAVDAILLLIEEWSGEETPQVEVVDD